MDKKWYVLQSKPLREVKVSEQIIKKNIEVYLPLVETIRYWSDRKKKVKVPLFSGYLFVHADNDERYEAISGTHGALKYLKYQKRFAIIKDDEINNIRISLIEPERIKIEEAGLYEGDFVEITHGIFKGLKGVIVQFHGNYKLMVSIVEMDTTFSVQLNNSDVRLINRLK